MKNTDSNPPKINISDIEVAVKKVIQHWRAVLVSSEALASQVGANFKWEISGFGTYSFLCRGSHKLLEGDYPVDFSIYSDAEDFVRISTNHTNPQEAYLEGRLRLQGDFRLALSLVYLFNSGLAPSLS